MVSGFFTRKIAQVKSVGSLLEERRISLGISLERVSYETGVRESYLAALEKSDLNNLPANVYVRGFIKTYALYLRLNEQELLAQWDRERDIAEHMQAQSNSDATEVASGRKFTNAGGQRVKKLAQNFKIWKPVMPKIRFTPVVIKTGVIVLVVLAGFLYLTLAVSSLAREPVLTLEEPISDKEVSEDSIVFVGATDSTAQISINDQSIFVDESGKFRETISLKNGLNEIKIIATNKLGRSSTLTRLIQANLGPVAGPANEDQEGSSDEEVAVVHEAAGAPVDLRLKIKDGATWVLVEADGKSVFDGTLLPGSLKEFAAQEYITLTTGKGENTSITFNGASLDNLGEGVVRQIRFTPDLSIRDLNLTASRD